MVYLFNTGARHGFPSYHVLFTAGITYLLTRNPIITNFTMLGMGTQRVISKDHTIIDVGLTFLGVNLVMLVGNKINEKRNKYERKKK